MIIDETTGLPQVPEGHYWAVEESNHPIPGTLYVILRKKTQVTKQRTVTEEVKRPWYNFWTSPTASRVENYMEGSSDPVWSEKLLDKHVVDARDENKKMPTGPGWELESNCSVLYVGGVQHYNFSTWTSAQTIFRYYRHHPATPESVLAGATKAYESWQASLQREEEHERLRAVRAGLVGIYPPKKLEGSE